MVRVLVWRQDKQEAMPYRAAGNCRVHIRAPLDLFTIHALVRDLHATMAVRGNDCPPDVQIGCLVRIKVVQRFSDLHWQMWQV